MWDADGSPGISAVVGKLAFCTRPGKPGSCKKPSKHQTWGGAWWWGKQLLSGESRQAQTATAGTLLINHQTNQTEGSIVTKATVTLKSVRVTKGRERKWKSFRSQKVKVMCADESHWVSCAGGAGRQEDGREPAAQAGPDGPRAEAWQHKCPR